MANVLIKNETRNFEIEAELANSWLEKTIGLGFSGKRRNMFFRMTRTWRWDFWMMGMSYAIKIIFIDENGKVVEIQSAIPITVNPKTWRLHIPKIPCKYILEIYSDDQFSEGDAISWVVS